MRKGLFLLLLVLSVAFTSKAQIADFKPNASEQEKSESVIYKNFVGECDLMIAYTTESYWSANRKFYNLLALNKKTWFRGYLFSEKLKSGKWTYPKVRFEEVDPDSAAFIANYLKDSGFYKLNRDSLNIDTRQDSDYVERFSISDGLNYKFEVLSGSNLSIIESYAADELFKAMPEITIRAVFIKCRDWFILKYKALEAIEE